MSVATGSVPLAGVSSETARVASAPTGASFRPVTVTLSTAVAVPPWPSAIV